MITRTALLTPLIALVALSAGCGARVDIGAAFGPPSGVVSRTSRKIATHRLKRIGVLPFRNESGVEKAGINMAKIFYEGLAPSPRFEVQPPPSLSEDSELQFEFRLRGGRGEGVRNRAQDTSWLKEKVDRFISNVQPYLTNLEVVYPGEHFEGKIEKKRPEPIRGTVAKAAGGAADEPPLDAILTGVVTKYRNRSGGPLIGDQGPHVTYTAYLVSTKDGEILWEATFNEEQIFLMDNLLLLPRYAEHGFIWQKNDQLARSGLKRVLATFPGLREKIEEGK